MGRVCALALMLIVAPSLAVAEPSAKDKDRASDLVKKAIAKSQAGDHETAVGLYLDAYKIIPQPLLLSNIGSEYQQMNKPVEALKYFCKYIEADPTGSNMTYALAQARTLYVDLGGKASVDDKDLCKPIVKANPEPKTQPTTTPIETPVTTKTTSDTAKTKQSPLRYTGLVVGTVGVAVFGLGVYYGFHAQSITDELNGHDVTMEWPANTPDRQREGQRAENMQIGLMIGGGVAIAAGVTMFLLGRPPHVAERDGAIAIVPVATNDSLGFSAAGRF
jgi:hypothetical protein